MKGMELITENLKIKMTSLFKNYTLGNYRKIKMEDISLQVIAKESSRISHTLRNNKK
jgi:hypothetical protein